MNILMSLSADNFTATITNGGGFNVRKNGKLLMHFVPTQLKSTLKSLEKNGTSTPALVKFLNSLVADGAIKKQKAQQAALKAHRAKLGAR